MRAYTLRALLVASILSLHYCALAQLTNIKVAVSSAASPLDAMAVSVLSAKDSTWLRSELTDKKGVAVFHEIAPGSYLIAVTGVGYKSAMLPITAANGDTNAAAIEVQKETTTLGEVSVTAKKPFMEMSLGKTTVNIEGSATTAGSNALDLMRKLPGVSVDENGTIIMRGKEGLLMLIDDRPTYLTGDELAQYLKTISADDVSQIELVTQPGAKYDAAGNTGLINIKLKKNHKEGWNGHASASYGQGVYFYRNEELGISYKRDKLNMTLNAGDLQGNGFADWREHLYFYDGSGNLTGTSVVHSYPVEHFSNTSLRLAADYHYSDHTAIGANVRGVYHPNRMPFDVVSADSGLATVGRTLRDASTKDFSIRTNLMANAYLTYKPDKKQSLDFNADYLGFAKLVNEQYNNVVTDVNNLPVADPLILSSRQPYRIDVYTIKADYTYDIKPGLKLEAGAKSAFAVNDYNGSFMLYQNGAWTNDTSRSNHFKYTENINAVYAGIAKNFGSKWETKIGFRVEHTVSEGHQFMMNETVRRDYISPFPTAFIGYKADSANNFELNYGRRIGRPSYGQLNPYAFYSFQNTYQVGNPYLRPQYTSNVELKHSYKNMLITTLTYSAITDVIADLLEVRGNNKVVYNTDANLASNSYIALAVTFNKEITKWWTLNVSASTFSASYSGMINGTFTTIKWSGGALTVNEQFAISEGWKGELNVTYIGPGRRDLAEQFEGNVYSDAGISKKINDRWQLQLHASDPLHVSLLRIHDRTPTFREETTYRNASQSFSLGATFNFGNNQSNHSEARPDEDSRVK